MSATSSAYKSNGKTIGFVPTMGALHEGHLSLIRQSVVECDITVVSIFVNPLQFGPNEDFDKYPRTEDRDAELCKNEQVDILILPDAQEITPDDNHTFVDIKKLQDNLCGSKRPGHFRGVCTIVTKLFNIVSPHKAFFGKKDIQQYIILKKMTEDLFIPTKVIGCPIVRDENGLALSSRNKYLTEDDYDNALLINKAIKNAKKMFDDGETTSQILKNMVKDFLTGSNTIQIDYINIVNQKLEDTPTTDNESILAIAVYINKTRLIDNHIFGENICW